MLRAAAIFSSASAFALVAMAVWERDVTPPAAPTDLAVITEPRTESADSEIALPPTLAAPEGAPTPADAVDFSASPVPRAMFLFPSRAEWERFSNRLDQALADGHLDALIALEAETSAALTALRSIPGHVDYADWLHERLQDIHVAQRTAELTHVITSGEDHGVPLYPLWVQWLRDRAPPARAQQYLPELKAIFVSEQLPPALVWVAEAESSFNPRALSPAGARGLFQLMPDTARELGLSLHPRDERLDPLRNARMAARYLAKLQAQYQDWPLALAAYNAGPGRVSALLAKHRATTFAEIAGALPVETQLYVPKVLATLTVREGLTPAALEMTQSAVATRD